MQHNTCDFKCYTMSYYKVVTHNYPLDVAQILSNNAIKFHKMLENIKPTIDDCILKLLNYLNKAVKIKQLNNYKKVTKSFKNFCIKNFNNCIKPYITLTHLVTIIKDTVLSFEYMVHHNVEPILYLYQYETLINYSKLYNNWIHYITYFLSLPWICNNLHNYSKLYKSILNYNKQPYKYNHKKIKYKLINYGNIKNTKKIIKMLHNYYTYEISNAQNIVKDFAILSAARYKDIKNNTEHHNTSNYVIINYALMGLGSRIDLPYNPNIDILKNKINELNIDLSYYWKEYIRAIKEQNKLQSIIEKNIKRMIKITNKCTSRCNNCNYCNLYSKYKKRILIFNIILQNIFIEGINNIIIKMSSPLQKLEKITREYNKNNYIFTKIGKNYANYISILFS